MIYLRSYFKKKNVGIMGKKHAPKFSRGVGWGMMGNWGEVGEGIDVGARRYSV
jgi:hypothetical protein